MPDADARVAVVVATRDRVTSLLATLARLRALPERPPLVVVDNGSRDGTVEAVRREHPDVTVVALDGNRGAAARTAGVERVETPYVAFADDDSWWAPGALARAADLLDACSHLGLLAARVLVGREEEPDPACAAMAASPLAAPFPLPGPAVLGFIACGAVVRRDAYLAAGGFHPRLGTGAEEKLLAVDLARRGWGLAYVEDVVAHHHPSERRDDGRRRAVVTRNDLWFTWLRRPARSAGRRTLALLGEAAGDAAGRRGVVEALAGLRWVLREREVVPPELELAARLVEL